MWAKARAVGNAPALSTGRAGARQRIVHMSTARGCAGGRGCAFWGGRWLWPVAAVASASLPGVGAAGFA
jgi:hypothetical protein